MATNTQSKAQNLRNHSPLSIERKTSGLREREDLESAISESNDMIANVENLEPAVITPENDDEKLRLEKVASAPPWSSFGSWEKKFIVMIASLGAFFSPLTTNIYFPALNSIASDLTVSISQVNLSITTYMIFQGLAPSFLGTFADVSGRRPAYVIGFFIYIASNIGLALNNTYVGLMVLRCIQSCGSSGMVTLKTAIIADVVNSAERGSYIAFTSLGSILGPSIAPVAGGLIAQHLGWHWIFWFLVIVSTAFFIPLIAFFPETGRQVVGDGSIPPKSWNKSLLNVYKEHKQRRQRPTSSKLSQAASAADLEFARRRRYPNPWSTILIMREKETALLLFYAALIYAGFYAVSTTITTQFSAIYHLSPTFTGLLFLPQALGSIGAAFTNGKLLDANYRRHATRLGIAVDKKKQRSLIGFPIERARLEIALPMFSVGAISVMIYGWLLEYKVKIAGPIVMLFVTGYTCLAGFSTFSVLIVDIHRDQPATASAASNLTRCLLGAGASAVVNPMIEAIGNGWCFTLIGLVWMATLPVLWLIMKHGPQWRAQRAEITKEKSRKEQEKEGSREREGEEKVESKKAGDRP